MLGQLRSAPLWMGRRGTDFKLYLLCSLKGSILVVASLSRDYHSLKKIKLKRIFSGDLVTIFCAWCSFITAFAKTCFSHQIDHTCDSQRRSMRRYQLTWVAFILIVRLPAVPPKTCPLYTHPFASLCFQIVLQTLLSFVMTCYGIVHIAGEFKDMDASSELKNK